METEHDTLPLLNKRKLISDNQKICLIFGGVFMMFVFVIYVITKGQWETCTSIDEEGLTFMNCTVDMYCFHPTRLGKHGKYVTYMLVNYIVDNVTHTTHLSNRDFHRLRELTHFSYPVGEVFLCSLGRNGEIYDMSQGMSQGMCKYYFPPDTQCIAY